MLTNQLLSNESRDVVYEFIHDCPVCRSPNRSLLYQDLKDYRCQKNSENLYCFYLCLDCRNGYYSPRPTKDSIHILYQDYGTHTASEARREFTALGLLGKVKRKIANGYTNSRYKTADKEIYWFGSLLINVLTRYKSIIDLNFRFIPPASIVGESTLLDFGCGNGGFLEIASRCGYVAWGIDFDSEAVLRKGLLNKNLLVGDILTAKNLNIQFDVITLSHVIEHVFDPIQHLRILYDLLKPGGFLYIETPNLNSIGHQYFKNYWRGLEPPRHIQVFNKKSLIDQCELVGFESIKVPTKFNPIDFICKSSNKIKNHTIHSRIKSFADSCIIFIANCFSKDREEFIYLTARKSL